MTDMDPDAFRAYVAKHVDDYVRTDGDVGAELNGLPCVVLTTTGRKSGEPRHSPIIRVKVPATDDYVAVASMGGQPRNPGWFHNLVADPVVELQDRADRARYRARVTDGDERAELWDLAVGVYAEYAEYQARCERVIPVMRLTPIEDADQ